MFNSELRPKLHTVCIQFVSLLLALMSIRWFFFEPFTVPSGSMFPSLMINDYILVNKMSSGLKIPYSDIWLWGPNLPQRGRVLVFWSDKSKVYFVKRLMGLPGDQIKVQGNRILEINGQPVESRPIPRIWEYLKEDFPYEDSIGVRAYEERYDQIEDMGLKVLNLMYIADEDPSPAKIYSVPVGKLFFMGDHRSSSSDSRVWGFVDIKDIVGPVQMILFSCAQKNTSTQFCDPTTIRWKRFMRKLQVSTNPIQ